MYFLCIFSPKKYKIAFEIQYQISKEKLKKEYYLRALTPLILLPYRPFKKTIESQVRLFFQRILDYQTLGKNFNEALFLMKENQPSPLPLYILEPILCDLTLGNSLLSSFQKHPLYFNKIILGSLHTAFNTGNINSYLELFLYQSKKINVLKKNLKQQLFYPIILTVMVIFLSLFYHFQILPNYLNLFKTLQINNSLHQSNTLEPWHFIIIISSIFLFKFKWHIPFIYSIKKNYDWWLWSHTMFRQLTAGYSFIKALQISLQHHSLKEPQELYQSLLKGHILNKNELSAFPWNIKETIHEIILYGEKPEIFKKLCDILDAQLHESTQKIEHYMQPILTIILGIVCSRILWKIYQPLLNLNIYN